ncbi:MAG TPA: hypothetical protein VEL74_16905 [Thermoanaerobaculia bacterium]|nr:hypothetical protein [Thermoanaerobaculia bacterium]
MPPCTDNFGTFPAPATIRVLTRPEDQNVVYSLSVVVQARDSEVVFEHFVHSRTDLENGAATWTLEPSRVYTLALITLGALTLRTVIEVDGNPIVNSSCSNSGAGVVGVWTIPTGGGAS